VNRLIRKLKSDLLALIYFGSGIFLSFALGTFNAKDPSLNSMNWGREVHNACGVVGSFIADASFQMLGLAAFLFPLALFVLAWRDLMRAGGHFNPLRMLFGFCLILTGAALLNHYWPDQRFFQNEIRAGGLAGLGIHHIMVKIFAPVGAQIMLWMGFALFAVCCFEMSVIEMLAHPGRLLKKLKDLLVLFWGALGNAFKGDPEAELKVNRLKLQTATAGASQEIKGSALFRIFDRDKAEGDPKASTPAPLLKIKDAPLKDLSAKPAIKFSLHPVAVEKEEDDTRVVNLLTDSRPPEKRKVVEKVKVLRRIENWELPKISLVEDPPLSRIRIDEKEIRRKADLLKEKMAHFSVRGNVVAAKPGPVVTMFEFKPDADVKLSKITELSDDLALALSSESLRIIAPIPGRDVVGIETANTQREMVYMKDMLAEEDFWREDIKLPIALGKQANGDPKIVDLRKMPHLMVAGTTGSGKSVFTVSTITGLLFRHSPKTLRLILIDPKQVDLAAFEKVPHLLMPVLNDSREAVLALKWAVREMEKRYKSMAKFGARGLEDYNKAVADLSKSQIEEHDRLNAEMADAPGKKGEAYYFTPQPYLVIVVEEFADLMVADKGNVETSVVRLAQKARACGIHLMICMQSPRKEVVTGLIRTNFSSRIAFKVSDAMESRIILDGTGAERLLAQGDMLFKGLGSSNLVRHHGPYLKDGDITAVMKHWNDQAEPEFDQGIMKALEGNSDSGDGGDGASGGEQEYDEKYDEILAWVATQKDVSASLIQRRFQLGYPRAARMIETFERENVVGPANGSKPRQVLIGALGSMSP
jgi:S-DNA-T family DNA segregation ATPase FtsK/SpoIIIE